MKTNIILLILGFLFFVLISSSPAEIKKYPYSYKQTVPGGEYIFVMLSKRHYVKAGGLAEEDKQVDNIYPNSGLYPASGSPTPEWTVEWFAHKGDVYLSSDGVHCVRMMGPWERSEIREEMNHEAVEFYAYGNMTAEYNVSDLVNFPSRIQHSDSFFEWAKTVSFDDKLSQFTIFTVDDYKYVFDVNTGKMLIKKQLREFPISLSK